LTEFGSALFGLTVGGGLNDDGTMFSINADGTGFQTLYSFSGADGASPHGDLALSGSTLYGMTNAGGTLNDGVIFAYNPAPEASSFAMLASAAVTGLIGWGWRQWRRA